MLCRRAKQSSSACPNAQQHRGHNRKYYWLIWLFPIAGLLSLIWFLIRVIPKPSRATYPCQRVAAPLASGFVVWLTTLIGSTLAYRKAKRLVHQSRYVLAGICVAVSVMAVWWSLNVTAEAPAEAAFTPTDPPNSPMGVAKGIHPGRVAWVRDPAATRWDGSTGSWWDDDNTDQDAVDYMVSKSVQTLTGEPSDTDAWDALFRHFNQTKGFGDIGYQAGEKVAIKINKNEDDRASWTPSRGVPSPHVIYSVLDQLINVVGVPGSAITVYDASRYIGDPIFDKIRGNPDPNFQNITFVVKSTRAGNGRIAAVHDPANPIYTQGGTAYLPRCVTEAKYLINMALLRPHTLYGITLCAKNHFGSVRFPSVSGNDGWTPSPLHNFGGRDRPMNTYNCLVNLNGHKHLAGKTLLYMIDALYPSRNQNSSNGYVIKYLSFGDNWLSSLFVSQDPVAIDSVGLDFLRHEDQINPAMVDVSGYPDNYLHEMAQADNPPSGTVYDPERDGIRLESMGVHEHWNNAVDRQYSRNLGTGDGIELVTPSLTSPDGPVENLKNARRYDYIRHAVGDANTGDEIIVGPGFYNENVNLNGKNLTIRSIAPNDAAVVAATVIHGSNQAVTFSGGEDATCVLAGFTITGAKVGIYCSGTSPSIINCRVVANQGAGIKLWNSSNPTITNCVIAGNKGAGIEMWAAPGGRFVMYNYAGITNCTIVENFQQGIWDGKPTITNCIVYGNGRGGAFAQMDGIYATANYSNIQDGWTGTGNINADPQFVRPGYWDENGTPAEKGDDFWVAGDYHLQWNSLCINAGDPDFVVPMYIGSQTDIDGEPRIMAGRVDIGSDEVGQKQADFSRNGIIDLQDIVIFVQTWLTGPGEQSWDLLCDLSGDEYINLADWSELAMDWLWQADWYNQ